MDETATCSSVAVLERVDGLELRVRDRRLGDSRYVRSIEEGHQIVEQPDDLPGWRRNVDRVTRVVESPADPVLHRAHGSGLLRTGALRHQDPVELREVLARESGLLIADRDGGLHC